MESFQKIVLIFFIVLFIFIIVFIGISLSKLKKSAPWPPLISQCPDFWIALDSEGNVSGNVSDSKCVNVKGLGSCKPKNGENELIMDFNESIYTGTNGNCAKYNWAKQCNVSWDGITYGTLKNPCDTTTTS